MANFICSNMSNVTLWVFFPPQTVSGIFAIIFNSNIHCVFMKILSVILDFDRFSGHAGVFSGHFDSFCYFVIWGHFEFQQTFVS